MGCLRRSWRSVRHSEARGVRGVWQTQVHTRMLRSHKQGHDRRSEADTPRHDAPHSPASVWITGFTHVNLSDDCPENTGLRFAECEEATGTVPSVARRRAFRSRRPTSFPCYLFPSGCGGVLQLRRSRNGGQLQTGLQVALDGG